MTTHAKRPTTAGTLYEHEGLRLTAAQWSRRLGISREGFRQRVAKGYTEEELFRRGPHSGRRPEGLPLSGKRLGLRLWEWQGEKRTLADWAAHLGYTYGQMWRVARNPDMGFRRLEERGLGEYTVVQDVQKKS